MGIYLGQLPPAEIARLKAELAETLIANFCYPRFFDHRTESFKMRPVDRTKRQEVWLYLSSVDFTAWSRIDLMTPELQHQIERLFIQFVQRNRNFFGNQGRRRMSDIRLLIGSCSGTVTQNLRNHLTGQKSSNPPFGTPRPMVSWGIASISGRAEPSWEQISASTMTLQQQLQEVRGEAKSTPPMTQAPAPMGTGPSVTQSAGGNGAVRQSPVTPAVKSSASRPNQPLQVEFDSPPVRQPAASAATAQRSPQPVAIDVRGGIAAQPTASIPPVASVSTTMPPPRPTTETSSRSAAPRKLDSLSQPYESKQPAPMNRAAQPTETPVAPTAPASSTQVPTPNISATPSKIPGSSHTSNGTDGLRPPTSPLGDISPALIFTKDAAPSMPRSATSPMTAASLGTTANGAREMMSVGEDDLAIFEQMRHQLIIWLRIEAVTAGLEITSQGAPQLLEMLRQQARYDETRLQVVSTLLNLANQVIKTGLVSVLDYKQALMFHLMHTRRV